MKSFNLLVFALFIIIGFECCNKKDSDNEKTIKDIDGNIYHSIMIGTQTWMIENLNVTHYRNGLPIQNLSDSISWGKDTTGAFCDYNNSKANTAIYGHLYNWFAIKNSSIIAPLGWHVPSQTEWETLVDFLGGSKASGKLKANDTIHWHSPNVDVSNSSGFTALPGGLRNSQGTFYSLGDISSFWTSTPYEESFAFRAEMLNFAYGVCDCYSNRRCGYSIRCIKDKQ
jgi:uncharacterized protein (TIGR02145 family)